MTRRISTTLVVALWLFALVLLLWAFAMPVFAQSNPGQCPDGYTNIDYSGSLSWTADADYDVVILVGGPPNDNNQDPDGRNKTFHDVVEGQTISREFHNISHICVLGGTPSTTTTSPTTSPTTTPTTSTTPSSSSTTTTTPPTTTTPSTTSPPTSISPASTTTVPGEVGPSQTTTTMFQPVIVDPPPSTLLVEATTTTPAPNTSGELPRTGLDLDALPWLAVAALVVGGGLVWLSRGQES